MHGGSVMDSLPVFLSISKIVGVDKKLSRMTVITGLSAPLRKDIQD